MPLLTPTGVPARPFRTRTLEQMLQVLRLVHGAMLALIVFLGLLAESLPHSAKPAPEFVLYLLMGLAVLELAAGVMIRKLMVESAETALQTDPADQRALLKWSAGQMVAFALCEAIALYGFVLRMVGAPRAYAIGFYVTGAAFLLLFAPRRP